MGKYYAYTHKKDPAKSGILEAANYKDATRHLSSQCKIKHILLPRKLRLDAMFNKDLKSSIIKQAFSGRKNFEGYREDPPMSKTRKPVPATELFKDGDTMAIRTARQTEREFVEDLSVILSDLIDSKRYEGDWEFQFGYWLPQAFDIVASFRGYKTDARTISVREAGGGPYGELVARSFDNGQVLINNAEGKMEMTRIKNVDAAKEGLESIAEEAVSTGKA